MTPAPASIPRPASPAGASVLAGALCLSLSAVLVELAGVDAATTAVLRCAIAVVVLVPLAVHERVRRGRLSSSGVGWALAAGVALGIDYAAWTASIHHIGAGISTVLINVQVIVLPVLAFFIDRERITARFAFAMPLMLAGISLVGGLWDTGMSGPHAEGAHDDRALAGTALGVLAGAGYGVYLFLTRRAAPLDPGRMVQPLAWATASAALTALAVSPLSGGVHLRGIPVRSWALLVALAVIGQVVAWLLIHQGSIRLPPARTAALLLAQPVLALALSAAVLHERPTALQLSGTVVVLAGVAAANGMIRRGAARGSLSRGRRPPHPS